MKLLLDTHVLLWAAGQPERLPRAARALLNDPHNEPIFSSETLHRNGRRYDTSA